jgi:dTMP kinase
MPARGKLIVLEGIDGSGKGTQLNLLAKAFNDCKIAFTQIGFPNYQGFFGKMAGQFLNGDFGPLHAVDAHLSALLYAGDRWELKPTIEGYLAEGKAVLADRYIASNLAHQGARVAPAERNEFLAWLKRLEYDVYGLPPENLVLYLRVPVSEAQRLVGQKATRAYTDKRHDIQEADKTHLDAAAQVYETLSHQPNWAVIDCWDAASGTLRPPESIHTEVLSVVESRIFPSALHGKI